MRAFDPSRLLDRVVRIVEEQVVPTLADPDQRSTLLILAGLLDNLSTRVEEQPDLVRSRVLLLHSMLESRPTQLLAGEPPLDTDSEAALRSELTTSFRRLNNLPLPQPEVEQWLSYCRDLLLRHNDLEVQRMRPTRYGSSLETKVAPRAEIGDDGLA